MHESGEGRGSTDVRVKHVVEAAGNHVVRFCCALWVYNCTGLPIALQQVTLVQQQACAVWLTVGTMHGLYAGPVAIPADHGAWYMSRLMLSTTCPKEGDITPEDNQARMTMKPAIITGWPINIETATTPQQTPTCTRFDAERGGRSG